MFPVSNWFSVHSLGHAQDGETTKISKCNPHHRLAAAPTKAIVDVEPSGERLSGTQLMLSNLIVPRKSHYIQHPKK